MSHRSINLVIRFLVVIAFAKATTAQSTQNTSKKRYSVRTVAFYNLENLFDTEDDPDKLDERSAMMEMSEGQRKEVYPKKIANMARVISEIGTDIAGRPPVLLGVAEIENRKVLEDLASHKDLKDVHYGIEHYEGPDARSIDVGLLYDKDHFTVIESKSHTLILRKPVSGDRIYTRDQLAVTGDLDGDRVSVIVNHWPSRRGGEARSRSKRVKAAELTKKIMDSIHSKDSMAKIIVMGDLNDDPINESVKGVLKAQKDRSTVESQMLYNPMEQMHADGYNTLAYRDAGNLFDQIMVTYPLLNKADRGGYQYWKAGIFNPLYMVNPSGNYKGYPMRSFVGSKFTGGYSDHFPVYVFLVRPVE